MEDKKTTYDEPELVVAEGKPINQNCNEEPPTVPSDHYRFYCNKCHTPYDLPNKTTSWRCNKCREFNSVTPGECTIL